MQAIELLKFLYKGFSLLGLACGCCLFVRYIYLEPAFSSKISRKLFWTLSVIYSFFCLGLPLEEGLGEFLGLAGIFFLFMLSAREQRKIRGIFLLFPVLGFFFALTIGFESLFALLGIYSSDKNSLWYLLVDAVYILGLLWFWIGGKNWRKRFQEENKEHCLKNWERNLLHISGLFLVVFSCILLTILENHSYRKGFFLVLVAAGSLCANLLSVTVISVVLQGDKKSFYQRAAVLQEYYLKAELEHFQAVQREEQEVRRLRHDMKNHYFAIRSLVEEKDYSALSQYMAQLGENISQLSPGFSSGNDLADAILREKGNKAEEKGIKLSLEGGFPKSGWLQPMDVCTIFSNALDNGMEALERYALSDSWIQVSIYSQKEILCLAFENPVPSGFIFPQEGNSEKAGFPNHGFGLSNIRIAAEKYKGSMEMEVLQVGGEKVFSLKVLLFAPSSWSEELSLEASQQNQDCLQHFSPASASEKVFLSGKDTLNIPRERREKDEMNNTERKDYRKDTGRISRQVLFYNLIMVGVVFFVTLIQTTIFIMQSPNQSPSQADMDVFTEQISASGFSSILAVVLGVGIYYLWNRKRKVGNEIFRTGQKKMTGKSFFQILVVFMMSQLLFSIFAICGEAFFNQLGYTMESSVESASGASSTITMSLYVGILGPVAEEVIYRGFVLRSLEKYGKILAIVVSSLFFGLMHGNLAQIFYAFLVGLVLGYVTLEYSIRWAILLHILNNGLFSSALNRLNTLFQEETAMAISYGILLAFFLAGCAVLILRRKQLAAYISGNQTARKYYVWALTTIWFLLFLGLELFWAITSLEKLP